MCPVADNELVDGLLGAMTWFETAYRVICARAEMERITRHEYVLLRMIARYAKRRRAPHTSELANALGVAKSYVTKLSRSLIDERLVHKVTPFTDRRGCALQLTEHGASAASTDYLAELLWELLVAEFGDDKACQLARALPHVARRPDFSFWWPVDDD
jgi:DNA-binding MarR family transcriptional regulator